MFAASKIIVVTMKPAPLGPAFLIVLGTKQRAANKALFTLKPSNGGLSLYLKNILVICGIRQVGK
jgi:hypothetical protein